MENRKAKILAIDDKCDNLVTLKALINDAFPDVAVFTALNGREGLELAVAEEPDVILLDVVMPEMDGFDVCQRLKTYWKTNEIPVVFVTAVKDDKENRIHALECGAEAFLAKPIDESELIAQVRAMIKIRTATLAKCDEKERLDALVKERTREIEKAHKKTLHLLEAVKTENLIRKKVEASLQQSEERFKLLFDKAPLGYQSLNSDGCFIAVNQQWLDTLDYAHEEVIGKWFGDFLCPEYVEGFRQRFPLFKFQGYIHSEFEMMRKDGKRLFIAFEGKVGYGNDGMFKQTHCILQDITEQKKAEKALAESEENYRYLFEHSGVGIGYYTPDGVVKSYNKKALKNMGGQIEDFIGKPISDIFPIAEANQYLSRIKKAATSDQPQEYEDYLLLNGSPKWFVSTFSRVLNLGKEIIGVHIASMDITERKRAEDTLLYLSNHDHLTELYNRRFFEVALKRLDKEGDFPISIIMCDVNGLKMVNDSFGHTVGDNFLKKIAEIIKMTCRKEDIVARLGGDEFAVILPKTNLLETHKIITDIKEMASKAKIANVELSISVGFDTKEKSEQSIVETLANAENQMYKHKLNESSSMRSKTIDLIMKTLFEKSNREMLHSKRVSGICEAIAIKMDYDKDEIGQIRIAGLLHDIGKIGIDEKNLNKNEKPNDKEWKEIKKHPEMGWRILSSNNEFSELANIVIAHHEKWDGSGYPNSLKGEEIPLKARIVTVADAYDAMTSERSYRKPLGKDAAIEELKKCSGTQFDANIVDVFLNLVLPHNSDFLGEGVTPTLF